MGSEMCIRDRFDEALLVVTNCIDLRVSLVCDCRHRILVADDGGYDVAK